MFDLAGVYFLLLEELALVDAVLFWLEVLLRAHEKKLQEEDESVLPGPDAAEQKVNVLSRLTLILLLLRTNRHSNI